MLSIGKGKIFMSRKRAQADDRQISLFDYLAKVQAEKRSDRERKHEAMLNVREPLRLAVVNAIRECKLSRHQIAGEMSHLLGCEITKTTLDAWTAESKPLHRLPAEYLPAFCKATGSTEPLDVLNESAGIFGMPGPDALRAEIQKFDEAEKQARAAKRKRLLFLEEMEGRSPGSRR